MMVVVVVTDADVLHLALKHLICVVVVMLLLLLLLLLLVVMVIFIYLGSSR